MIGAADHDAVLVVDDTALPKKGQHLVGVSWQYHDAPGKQANSDVRRQHLRTWLGNLRRGCCGVIERMGAAQGGGRTAKTTVGRL
jgi:DDE superfamily endonuclease